MKHLNTGDCEGLYKWELQPCVPPGNIKFQKLGYEPDVDGGGGIREEMTMNTNGNKGRIALTAATLALVSMSFSSLPGMADELIQRRVIMMGDNVPTSTTTHIIERSTVSPSVIETTSTLPSSEIVLVKKRTIDPTARFFIAGASVPAMDVWNALEARRLQLNNMISSRMVSGDPCLSETIRLKRKINLISEDMYAYLNDNEFNDANALALAGRLDDLSGETVNVYHVASMPRLLMQNNGGTTFLLTTTTTPLYVERVIDPNLRVVTSAAVIDDVTVRRKGLEDKLAVLIAAGKMSSGDAAEIRAMLDNCASMEASFRLDGSISDSEAKQLYNYMDKIGSEIDEEKH